MSPKKLLLLRKEVSEQYGSDLSEQQVTLVLVLKVGADDACKSERLALDLAKQVDSDWAIARAFNGCKQLPVQYNKPEKKKVRFARKDYTIYPRNMGIVHERELNK